jgi:hypothetical protein
VRHRWTRLTYVSIAATYGSYAFWRFQQIAQAGGAGGEFGMGVTFLAAYWVLFTAAVFLAPPQVMRGSERVSFLTANNGAFFAFAAQHFAAHRPDVFWMFALGYGAVLLGLAVLAARLRSEERALDGAYLAQGFALVTLGLAAKLTGPQLAVVLAVESATLLTGSRRRHAGFTKSPPGSARSARADSRSSNSASTPWRRLRSAVRSQHCCSSMPGGRSGCAARWSVSASLRSASPRSGWCSLRR